MAVEETDSQRNLRLSEEAGSKLVTATAHIVGAGTVSAISAPIGSGVDNPAPNASAGGSGDAPVAPSFSFQAPAPIAVRYATIEQLQMLRDGKRDAVAQIGWALLALAVGAAPSAVPDAFRFIYRGAALSKTDFIQSIMTAAGLVAAIVCAIIVLSRGRKANDLYESIVNPGQKNANKR